MGRVVPRAPEGRAWWAAGRDRERPRKDEGLSDAGRDDWDLDLDAATGGTGQVTDRLRRAAVLTRRDPLRRGNVIHLPARGDAAILGDLHGDRENFQRVLRWAALHRHRDRFLVVQELIHGGPRDESGGDTSFRLLEDVAALKCQFRSQIQVVLSNHDLAEVVGTDVTKAGEHVRDTFHQGIRNAYGSSWEAVLEAYRDFLASLPLAVRTPNGVFISHSTPGPESIGTFDYGVLDREVDLRQAGPASSVYRLVWDRDYDQACADRFAKAVGAQVLVTGHRASMPGLKRPTSRHLVLQSDGVFGRVLLLPLGVSVLPGPLSRTVQKIRDLPA